MEIPKHGYCVARMGQVVFSNPEQTELRVLGLGSCIGLCIVDPATRLAAVAHVVLPEAKSSDPPDPGKYADTAVPHMIRELAKKGAAVNRLRAAIAGGAQLFTFDGASESLNVGERNIAAVKRYLTRSKVRLVAEDVGGKAGRTLVLDTTTWDLTVRQTGLPEKRLANLLS
jgi:chemotaxis protein CheD